jgi:hypothetical protein
MLAREIIALVAPFNFFLHSTGPDSTDLAAPVQVIGEAAFAFKLVWCYAVDRG